MDDSHGAAGRRKDSPPTANERRGMAIVLVLVVLSIGLTMAFAMMRVQTTAEQVQNNSIHRGDARQAALAGMSIGLRKMHQSDWTGVGTVLTGSLNASDSYEVSYATGDPNLTPASSDYAMYPFRVTVTAKGFSTDPGSGAKATHKVRAVVQLVPRKIADPPTDWADVQPHVVFQKQNDSFEVHMPVQFRGSTRIQGTLKINDGYTNWTSAANKYFIDLQTLFNHGTDHRPFTGPLFWSASQQSASVISWLNTRLGLTATNVVDKTLGDWRDLAPNSTYQLYPGGQTYNVLELDATVGAGTTLDADPLTNPLGLYYGNDDVRLGSNVTIRGTIVVQDDLIVDGTNVTLNPLELPPLDGSMTPVRLPTVIAQEFEQPTGMQSAIRGLVSVDDEFDILADTQNAAMTLEGKLVAQKIYVRERAEWDAPDWNSLFNLLNLIPLIKPLFPNWAEANYNAQSLPKVVVKGDPTTVAYHWITRGVPLYAVHPSDSGLRWEIVGWKDNP